MIKDIMRDELFLQMKSLPATKEDKGIADDLLDTLKANAMQCVGMAANMIGVQKCIIAFLNKESDVESRNYKNEWYCLSSDGGLLITCRGAGSKALSTD